MLAVGSTDLVFVVLRLLLRFDVGPESAAERASAATRDDATAHPLHQQTDTR